MGIWIAKISSIQKETGMVSVVISDQEDSATDYMPFFAFAGEFLCPQAGDMVLVADLSSEGYGHIVLGGFWNRANTPPDPGAAWVKKVDDRTNISAKDGVVTIHARDVVIDTGERRISLAELAGGG